MRKLLAAVAGGILALATAALAAESVAEFVARHWAMPIPPQGAPPPGWSALETSLQPEACGTCHPKIPMKS